MKAGDVTLIGPKAIVSCSTSFTRPAICRSLANDTVEVCDLCLLSDVQQTHREMRTPCRSALRAPRFLGMQLSLSRSATMHRDGIRQATDMWMRMTSFTLDD